jgi:putative restriction endonuclease
MYLALIEPGSYLDFANTVPFRDASGIVERGVLNANGKVSGRAQSAVRSLSPADFSRIIERGLADDPAALPRVGDPSTAPGLHEEQAPFPFEQRRQRIEAITSRLVRDRVFRRVVLKAYDSRCAVTGLKLINGSGRAEVEAAHIRPVEAMGPDIVSNGVALSGTAHWMFDRGLIGISDDLRILISRRVNDLQSVQAIINPTGCLLPTARASDRPHPHYLCWHRENCFEV